MSEHAHHEQTDNGHTGHIGHHEDHAHRTDQHQHGNGINVMAAAATLHCLTGCAIGEVLGLIVGTAAGMSNVGTVVLSIALAFLFGYTLSTLPLVRGGLALTAALTLAMAADTLSIATMEVVDNLVMTVIPGAMNAGLTNPTFWIGMPISLVVAFAAAYPVNPLPAAARRGPRPHPPAPRFDGTRHRRTPPHPDLRARHARRDHRGLHRRRSHGRDRGQAVLTRTTARPRKGTSRRRTARGSCRRLRPAWT